MTNRHDLRAATAQAFVIPSGQNALENDHRVARKPAKSGVCRLKQLRDTQKETRMLPWVVLRKSMCAAALGVIVASCVACGAEPVDTNSAQELDVDQVFAAEPVAYATETPPPAPQAEENLLDQRQENRIYSLELQLQQLQQRLDSGALNQGRPRSSDVADAVKPKTTYPTAKLTGFFQLDAGWFAQDTNSNALFGNIQDDRGFRRARLAAVGDLADNISYMMEMDFAFPGRPSFMDVWVDVHDVPLFGNVRVGQWRQPFGLDELTSVRELTFFERPTMFAFAPFRQTGIGFHDANEDETITWAASGYGFPTDFFGDSLGDRGYGTAERITGLLIHDEECHRVLHAGFDHAFTIPNNPGLAYRNVPEFGGPFGGPTGTAGDVPFFVNTGIIDADYSNILNAELAGVYESFHWQSEVRYALVNVAGTTVTLPSYYVQAGYILTGEVRPYNRTNAVLGRIKPNHPFHRCGGWGAWEVAARYSYIDLQPAAPFSAGGAGLLAGQPPGGHLNDMTVGLNWYLHANLKVQFQYVRAMLANTVSSSSTDIIGIRTQMDF
ncbi:MAG: hypothetical protein B7Z55_06430 [Planctomycetales bacterium 12-60-4]|nr:MAG: hypothetical protein B7Z55_06430 [Planctomycetales bacterium 12-60-4]